MPWRWRLSARCFSRDKSQAVTPSLSLQIFDSGSLLAAGLALPVPVLWALSGSLVSNT